MASWTRIASWVPARPPRARAEELGPAAEDNPGPCPSRLLDEQRQLREHRLRAPARRSVGPQDTEHVAQVLQRTVGTLADHPGGVLLIAVFVFVGVVVGPEPAGPAGAIERFPDVRAARTVENGLYLVALMAWVPLALALAQRLRGTALFGGGCISSG